MSKASVACLGLLLAACAHRVSHVSTPAIVQYTQADQAHLREELNDVPAPSEIIRWLNDYVGLRGQVRALNGQERGDGHLDSH